MDEQEIIKKAQKDKRFFEPIYGSNYDKILRYVASYVHNKELAEDLTSVTFEKALHGIDTFQWEGVSISSWLYRIARNTINDYYRKKINREGAFSLDQQIKGDEGDGTTFQDMLASSEEAIETQIITSEDEEKLYTLIGTLAEDEQYLLYYKYFEGLTNKDIAKLTSISETNVGTKLQRIREKIKKKL
jgi:RNA polymerase sigma factor (sigma-70 family)